MKIVENRRTSRIILTNDRGQVLLFRYTNWKGGSYWATPGGGVEDSETFEDAVLREAQEELGITAVIVTFLWERTVDIDYEDRSVHQLERYFHLRGELIHLSQAAQMEIEREGVTETRWWTIEELKSTDEVIFPEGLVRGLLAISDRTSTTAVASEQ